MDRDQPAETVHRRLGWIGVAGLALFCGWGVLLDLGAFPGESPFATIDWMTWLAPGCLVPLGTSLARDEIAGPERNAWRWFCHLLPLGAGCVGVSCALPRGELATALAAAGVVPAWLLARIGVAGVRSGRSESLIAKVFDFAFIAQFVGAFMLATSRSGYTAFGLVEPIVTLAATHFYFAGFALLVILAGVMRIARLSLAAARSRIGATLAACIPLALIAVAVGVMMEPLLELVGALLLASCGAGLAILLMTAAIRARNPVPARLLLGLAGLGLLSGSALGAAYAWTLYRGSGWPTQPLMIALHAPLQGLVFAFGGIVGLHLCRRPHPGAAALRPGR